MTTSSRSAPQGPGNESGDTGDLDRDALLRRLANLEAAYDRVRGEALTYRDQRDELDERARELHKTATWLRGQVGAARTSQEETLRKLRRTKKSLRKLERSRSVRYARRARRIAGILRGPWKRLRTTRNPEVATMLAPTDDSLVGAEQPAYDAVVTLGVQAGQDTQFLAAAAIRAERSAQRLASRLQPGRPLRIAAIVDDFTRQSLSLDCDLFDLHPDSWQDEIRAGDPDLLFVESAWRGEGGSWHNTVPKLTDDLVSILEHCRESGIPTVFWSKEDPVHFQTFLRTAKEFDFVFTTDIDCVPRYRAAFAHDRVGFLPFACQPRLQTPVETYDRKDGLGFAGGYYTRYRERMRDLEALLEGAGRVMPVEIWDRMYGTTLDEYRFPDEYQPNIVGTLAAHEIDVAYKGYRFGLNLNSVKHSQSMFARRALELLSSGTVTVSNYSRGIRVLLGDLVPMSDGADGIEQILARLHGDEEAYDRLRTAGLRAVHSRHTYAERLSFLVATITGQPYRVTSPVVTVLIPLGDISSIEQVLATVATQQGVDARPVFIATGDTAAAIAARGHRVIDSSRRDLLLEDLLDESAESVALLDPRDWYGPTYLIDLHLAFAYSGADVVGKATPARNDGGSVETPRAAPFRACTGLTLRRSALSRRAAQQVTLGDALAGGPEALAAMNQFAIDRFDYCEDGAGLPPGDTDPLLGSGPTDSGTPVSALQELLDRATSGPTADPDQPVLSFQALADVPTSALLKVEAEDHGVRYSSSLEPGKVDLRWLARKVPTADLWPDRNGEAYFEYDGDLHLMFAMRFFDGSGAILQSITEPASKFVTFTVPEGATEVAFAIRSSGPGVSTIRTLALRHPQINPVDVPSGNSVLLVADHYPSYDDLYRNGFVHTRVKAYREHGLGIDVFRTRDGQGLTYHEFGGIEVASGSFEALQRTIEANAYDTIVVHFMSERLWEALRPFHETHRIVCWVHGAEVKPWWRRNPEFLDAEALERARAESDRRVRFWQDLLDELPAKTVLVLVSSYFARELQADLGRTIPGDHLRIIHNPIDTDLFNGTVKDPESRKRLLSIRPFVSPKYANDLTVAALLELSRKPWFDELEICIVGDGPLFEETVAPLVDLPNVTLRQEFLTHQEIAELHREYGLFLVPTRSDTQGVSRDEAMASGLVPVTTDVEAVTEFLSDVEGYIAGPDDHLGLARAVENAYLDPEGFVGRSRAARARVRDRLAVDVVTPEEIATILGS